jgi:restriction endonuclease Mrr
MILTFVSESPSKWVDYEIKHAVSHGKPILAIQPESISKISHSLYDRYSIPVVEWTFDKLLGALSQETPTITYTQPEIVTANHEIILGSFDHIAKEIAANVVRDSNELYRLEPRRFEELIAYLFERNGYEVRLTQATRDGGVDLYAMKSNSFGKFMTIVDCKKYAPDRPIGIAMVREMYGVLNIEQASHAMLVTTSRFTTDARAMEKRYQYQMSLKDHADVARWLREI